MTRTAAAVTITVTVDTIDMITATADPTVVTIAVLMDKTRIHL
jgi:hypothetical protein